MVFKREVGALGRVVIPEDVRDNYGYHQGTKIDIEIVEGKIVISKSDTASEEGNKSSE